MTERETEDDSKYDELTLYLECDGGTTVISGESTTTDPTEIWDFFESHNTTVGGALEATDVTIYVFGNKSPYSPMKYEYTRPESYWSTEHLGYGFNFYEDHISCDETDG